MHLLHNLGNYHILARTYELEVHKKLQIFALMYHGAPTTSSSRASSELAFRTVTTDFSYGCFVPLVVSRLYSVKCRFP